MKIFQRYNPLQVAKYVKILFRGRLYIKDVGAFEFDKGKILIPKVILSAQKINILRHSRRFF
ncbi:Protein of uncharacterised function (DUF1107) [Salmonella enterica subsp. enterica serovar Typhi]|nr:Protein of uncharacterised function (DUF1107) [Salmonella enterica subsp. enterica serovar Typhi]